MTIFELWANSGEAVITNHYATVSKLLPKVHALRSIGECMMKGGGEMKVAAIALLGQDPPCTATCSSAYFTFFSSSMQPRYTLIAGEQV